MYLNDVEKELTNILFSTKSTIIVKSSKWPPISTAICGPRRKKVEEEFMGWCMNLSSQNIWDQRTWDKGQQLNQY
jgi:hypothetical protein